MSHPLKWMPTSYLTMGLVYVTVGSMANVMFKNVGFANDEAAFWSWADVMSFLLPRGRFDAEGLAP